MKKGVVSIFLIIFTLAFAINISSALDIPNYQDKYVNDFAGIFTGEQIGSLRTILSNIDQNTTAEEVVVTIKDCGGDYDGFAMQLVEKWKIGKADKDNGLLVLYCQTEKKLIVKTGYGIEGILPDSKVGRMLDEFYVPLRDTGKISEGIVLVSQEYAKVLTENRDEILSGQASGSSNNETDWITILFWLFIVYIIFSKILGRIYKGKKKKDLPWFFPIFIPVGSSNSSGGFGGGGFSGGGFGGGGFGGGGASR